MAERVLTLRINVEGNYEQVMSAFNRGVRGLGDAVTQPKSNLDRFNGSLTTIKGSLDAFGQAFTMIGDVNKLGQEVNIAQQTFHALAGGAESARSMLDRMRQQTGGVVSDLELMGGASRLLQMGLADSEEEVAGLTEMAIKLGGALGMDTNKAVEDFSLLLANMSYLRLDQFGIAASTVRGRVRELAQQFPEMSREARFAQAVLEAGQGAMENLGSAVNASSTAVERFNTGLTNLAQQGAANVNFFIEQAIRLGEVWGEVTGANMETGVSDPVMQRANEIMSAHGGQMSPGEIRATIDSLMMDTSNTLTFQQVQELERVLGTYEQISEEMNEQARMSGRMAMAEEGRAAMAENNARRRREEIHNQNELNLLLQQAASIQDDRVAIRQQQEIHNQNEMNLMLQQAAAIEAQREAIAERRATHLENERDLMIRRGGEFQVGQLMRGMEGPLSDIPRDAFGGFALPEMMSQERADAALRMYQEQSDRLAELKDLAQTMPDVVSEDTVARGEELVGQYERLAQDAQAAADALERASLAQLMGQGSGGRVGEMSDAVIQRMRDQGYSENQITEMQRALDLGTGRDTGVSRAMTDIIVPELAEMPPEQALTAMNNLNLVLTTLAGANIDPNTVLNAGNIREAAGLGKINEPGMRGIELGVSEDFDATAFGQGLIDAQTPAADIATNMTTTADAGAEWALSAADAQQALSVGANAVQTIASNLIALTKNPQEIALRFIVDASAIRLAINDALGQFSISRGVVDNGGAVPGNVDRRGGPQ